MSVHNVSEEFNKLWIDLQQRIEDLHIKKELLRSQKEGEMVRPTVWMMDSWSAADMISKKEENIIKKKREKNEIDLIIADLYETLTGLQLQKLAVLLNKLKGLQEKYPQQICPTEYSVEQYEDWLKTDPMIMKKQSEILECLTKKVRLTQACALDEESHVTERGANVYKIDMTKEFQRLKGKDEQKLKEPSATNKELSEYVRGLLQLSGCNFEAVKLREFIDQCYEKPHHEVESAVSPQNYHSFVCAMAQYIFTKYNAVVMTTDADPTARLDQIYSLVEEVVFPQVKEAAEAELENQDEKDRTLEENCEKFAGVDQQSLGIKEKFIDERIYPHCKAITEIMKLSLATTPTHKLKQILKAAHEVILYMNSVYKDDDKVPGADEFMDIWVYVILKARLARFFTTVALLRDYSNPRIRLSESGYYMASFELAGEYIRTLSADFPSRNARVPALSSAPDEVFFVAEVSLFHQFLESFRDALRVIQDEYCLEGFRLVVDFDQQLESGRLYTSFLTEDPSCCVFGALFCCRRDSKLNAGWVKAQMKKVSESVDVRTVNGVHVSVLDLPTADMLSLPRRLIDIPSGRFERYAPMLRRNLSFERIGRLGYTVGRLEFWANHSRQETVNVDEFLRETCVSIEDEYTGSDILDSDDFLVEKVKDIQVRLRSFNCYSKILPVNGTYNKATYCSVELFQRLFNERLRNGRDNFLNVNGICDSHTFNCLRESRPEIN